MNLFEKSPLAWKKIRDWSDREEEYVKRTAFSLIACLAWHDKKTEDDKFVELFPVLIKGATDERNFVKKAVIEDSVSRAKHAGVDFIIFGCMTLKEGRQKDYFMNVASKMYPEIATQYGTVYLNSKWGSQQGNILLLPT